MAAIKEFHALKASGIKPEKLLLVLNRIATPSEANIVFFRSQFPGGLIGF